MTFNQWFATQPLINSPGAKLAIERVWNELTDRGCASSGAGFMLSDLIEEIVADVREDLRADMEDCE